MRYSVYMVQCSDGTLYSGWTNDVTARIKAHNSLSSGAKYTRGRRPVVLVYTEHFDTKSKALRRECEFKKLTRQEKCALIKVV